VKQHLLSDGDRAALQALVPLAGALGVGTIFALFFGGRRKSGIAVFEHEKALKVVLPRQDRDCRGQDVACWVRKGRFYMDLSAWLRLSREAGARWRAFATGEALPPVGSGILVHVKVGFRIPWIRDRAVVRLSILEPARGGDARSAEVRANEDGLFDVTGLGIV
jgi:hypothetical protein